MTILIQHYFDMISMNYISTSQFSTDKVRVCKKDICVEARGRNAELIAGALVFAFICEG